MHQRRRRRQPGRISAPVRCPICGTYPTTPRAGLAHVRCVSNLHARRFAS